jgi:hypothetical protein
MVFPGCDMVIPPVLAAQTHIRAMLAGKPILPGSCCYFRPARSCALPFIAAAQQSFALVFRARFGQGKDYFEFTAVAAMLGDKILERRSVFQLPDAPEQQCGFAGA